MSTFIDNTYRKYLLPRRLVFFDLDGTIIPSTHPSGRRTIIAVHSYEKLKIFAKESLGIENLPNLSHEQCSQWHSDHNGPLGLIKHILNTIELTDDFKECLSDHYKGLFERRLEAYRTEDLKHDIVPNSYLDFLHSLKSIASLILISYRYQPRIDFFKSLEKVHLTKNGLFGAHNSFLVGGPSSSPDGSKARLVGKMWRREIRAQRRLTSDTGKTYPPIMIGDSIRDIHFAADSGGIFFGVCDTGVDSKHVLINEIKELRGDLDNNSRVFLSVADQELQSTLYTECESYIETLRLLPDEY